MPKKAGMYWSWITGKGISLSTIVPLPLLQKVRKI